MGSQQRFSDPRYINWIRDTLALIYWKEGVEKVANTEATTFHNDLQKALGIYGMASPSCTACTSRDIPKHFRGRWRMTCLLCHPWLVQIVQNHKDQPCPNIHRDNTDPQKWAARPWEVLKCYMGFGCQSIQSAEEADAQSILTMFKKCVHFSSCTRIGGMHLVDELLTIRNFLFHSGDYLVDDAKLDADIQTMLDFLSGLTALSTHEKQAVDDAINKITELRTNRVNLSIHPDPEVRALKEKHNALEKKLEQDLNKTNVKVTDLQKEIVDIIQRITTVEGDITNLQTGLADVEKEQKIDKLRITKNEADVKSLQSEQVTTTDRITIAEGGLRSIKMDMTHVRNELKQQIPGRLLNVEDLRKTLLDQYKEDTARIPIYLLKPAKKHPVESLYVKQHLRRIDPRGKSEHDKQSKTDDKHIDNITDILYKDGIVCKDVFVSAEAGLGKSTLCAHLVRLWCDAHSEPEETSSSLIAPCCGQNTNVASSDPSLEQDLQVMKQFKLLFYINLSDEDLPSNQPNCDEISDLIYKQSELDDTDYSRDYIVKCMSDKSTLVVMDSLDECQTKRLPYRGKHNQSCIVTTSRPWKLESLKSDIEKKHGHQQVEIVGLEETSPELIVENIVEILNQEMLEEDDMEKDGSQFLAEIENEGLHDFLHIPMLIVQMLMLWFDGKSFGSSQSEIYSNVVHHQIEVAVRNKPLLKHEGTGKNDFPLICNSKYDCVCKNYGELLWKVAHLAFSMLFQENRAKCLSFDSTEKSFKDLTEEDVTVCLKVGFLSEHKLFVKKMTEGERKSVSFPHKTNQEYFAAVYMSYKWSETVKTHIYLVIKDLDRAMELDKVLLFCNQLNPEVARELSVLIYQRADDDARVQEYREYGGDYPPNRDLIHQIQNIVSAAQQQTIKASTPQTTPKSPPQQPTEATMPITQCGSSSTPKLIMADVILCKPRELSHFEIILFLYLPRTEEDRSVNVEALDMAAVKSVHADAETADVTIWEMFEKQTRCLQTLVVKENYDCKLNVELIHGVVVRNQAPLRTLGLHGDISHLDLSPLGNKLPDMLTRDLTCLLLDRVDLSHEQCETLGRHLSTTDNLRQLTLSYMSSFCHEQCETLGRHLSTRQNLRQLTLVMIKCQTHGDDGGECCDVKLQSKLEHLQLRWLPFKHFSFPAEDLKTCDISLRDNVPAATSAISCLTSASNLQMFTCVRLREFASVLELETVLPRLHSLQRLDLSNIDLRKTRLSVVVAKTLEYVRLSDSTITSDGLESLLQSVDAPRVKIVLDNVTIRGNWRYFLQRVQDTPHTDVERDNGVEYEYGRWKVKAFWFYKNKCETS